MRGSNKYLLDFRVDRLTNSILNRISGDSFPTDVSLLLKDDLPQVQKNKGWLFNWRHEFNQTDRETYKLTISNNPRILQGAMSLSLRSDHAYIHLIENAPFNRFKDKVYEGVPGNLVAYACKLSFQRGGGGFVSFTAKTKLIDHYVRTLGAYHFGGHLMVIDDISAKKLVDKYFKNQMP